MFQCRTGESSVQTEGQCHTVVGVHRATDGNAVVELHLATAMPDT